MDGIAAAAMEAPAGAFWTGTADQFLYQHGSRITCVLDDHVCAATLLGVWMPTIVHLPPLPVRGTSRGRAPSRETCFRRGGGARKDNVHVGHVAIGLPMGMAVAFECVRTWTKLITIII